MHKTLQELDAALYDIRQSPTDKGQVALIVARPDDNARQVLETAQLTPEDGLVGDNWGQRKKVKMDCQINIMNVRVIAALSDDPKCWPLAGDQFFVDFDLSYSHIPPGTHLQIGSAVLLVTAEPHLGCQKFSERFGRDAVMFVNSDAGKQLNARGINATVVKAGQVSTGDVIQVTQPDSGL
jgi:hypothetical protein